MEEGPRNAPSPRGGVILVSLYSWTTVTVGAAIARLIIGRLHQVGFGRDDGAVIIGTVCRDTTICAVTDQCTVLLSRSDRGMAFRCRRRTRETP